MLPAKVVWKPSTGSGYEHLRIREENQQIHVDSIVVGSLDDNRLGRIKYDIVLDHNWVMREVRICHVGEGQHLYLSFDGNGIWQDETGQVLSQLTGAIDIDISCTPFTNTLPINRLSHQLMQTQEIDVVYISAVDLSFRQVKQRYTLLESRSDSAVFRYESGDFREDITVDVNGIVVSYPQLFEREVL